MTKTPCAVILGGSGQDGSVLAAQLLARGYRVYVTTRNSTTTTFCNWSLLSIENDISVEKIDPTDSSTVYDLFARIQPDAIFCLTGQSSVGRSFSSPSETIESHILPVINSCEAMRRYGSTASLIVASSGEIFGETSESRPASEDSSFHATSPYATAKIMAAEAARCYRDQYGLRVSIAYLFNHESPLRPAQFVFGKILAGIIAIAEGRASSIELGNGGIIRDWGWAPDYTDAMIRMAECQDCCELVLATGNSLTLQQCAESLVAAAGMEPQKYLVWGNSPPRQGEIMAVHANPQRAMDRIGWSGSCSFPALAHKLISPDWMATI